MTDSQRRSPSERALYELAQAHLDVLEAEAEVSRCKGRLLSAVNRATDLRKARTVIIGTQAITIVGTSDGPQFTIAELIP